MLWKRSGRRCSTPTESYKPLRRNLQAALAKGRKTLEEAVDANQAHVLSITFIPTFKFDEKILVGCSFGSIHHLLVRLLRVGYNPLLFHTIHGVWQAKLPHKMWNRHQMKVCRAMRMRVSKLSEYRAY